MPPYDALVLEEVVGYVCGKHSEFSSEWAKQTTIEKFNLKKKLVRDVIGEHVFHVEPIFLLTLDNYHVRSNMLSAEIELEYKYQDYDFRTRVKQKDSIINKVIHYSQNKQETGKVPLNKCLNDIMGLRMVFDELHHGDEAFQESIQAISKKYNLHVVENNKNGYVATHLYFKSGSNIYFPWELQIWSSLHAENNEHAHKEHSEKRLYTSWPHEYLTQIKLERDR